jgi:hypothetical protein
VLLILEEEFPLMIDLLLLVILLAQEQLIIQLFDQYQVKLKKGENGAYLNE